MLVLSFDDADDRSLVAEHLVLDTLLHSSVYIRQFLDLVVDGHFEDLFGLGPSHLSEVLHGKVIPVLLSIVLELYFKGDPLQVSLIDEAR